MKTLGTTVGETTGNGKEPEEETGGKKTRKEKEEHTSPGAHTRTLKIRKTLQSPPSNCDVTKVFFVLFCVFNQKVIDEWIKLKKAIIKHLTPRCNFFDYMATEPV